MNIQVLQGINLENNVTTIKIPLKTKLDTKLIEEIKNYHPIFLKSYEIKNNTLIIQSKLPNLWREIGKIIENPKARSLALEIISKQLKSMSTIAVLDVADKMNEDINHFLISEGILQGYGYSQFNRQYVIGVGASSTVSTSLSNIKDSQTAKQIQSDKYKTNRLLDRLNVPTAKWEEILSEKHLRSVFPKYKKPLVLKPTMFTGGRGVHIGIETLQKALYAYKDIKDIGEVRNKPSNKIIIQEQIDGEDYRLLVINGKLEAATKRVPAFVTGDGKKNIKELIQETNKDPRRNLKNPTHILKPINIDPPLLNYLAEQKRKLEYIPKAGEQVFVRKVASMSQGGITVDFTDKVNKQVKIVVETLAQTLRAYALGIDVICKDISKPLSKSNGGIIEVNTMPEAYLNMYPVLGPQRPQIAENFIKGLITPGTKKIVVIGGQREQILKIQKKLKGNTGLYSNNAIYINNELIANNVPTDKAIQSLKINAYLNNIILHYKNISEVTKYGFGFDKMDTLYIPKKDKNRISHIDKKLLKQCIITK